VAGTQLDHTLSEIKSNPFSGEALLGDAINASTRGDRSISAESANCVFGSILRFRGDVLKMGRVDTRRVDFGETVGSTLVHEVL